MPRQPRLNLPGYLYHIIIRGIERNVIYKDSDDYREFIRRINEIIAEEQAVIFAWALMPNHAHLLIRSGLNGIVAIMSRLLTGYAVYFNLRHNRVGHLFQNRYRSTLCDSNEYLLTLIRYIHLNPVKANIIKNIDELDAFPWTGHLAIMGKKEYLWQEVDSVLLLFSDNRESARRQYINYLQNGLNVNEDLEGGGLIRSTGEKTLKSIRLDKIVADERILGGKKFIQTLYAKHGIMTFSELKKENKISFNDFIKNVENNYNIKLDAIQKRSKSDSVSIPRAVIAYFAVKFYGKTYLELAYLFKVSESAISRMVVRFKRLFKEDEINDIKRSLFE